MAKSLSSPATPAAQVTTHIRGGQPPRPIAHLLEVRERLARYATERASHNLDDAHDAFIAMVTVEDEIAAQAPRVHAALFPAWVLSCEEIAHEPGAYNSRCGICLGSEAADVPVTLAVAARPSLPTAA